MLSETFGFFFDAISRSLVGCTRPFTARIGLEYRLLSNFAAGWTDDRRGGSQLSRVLMRTPEDAERMTGLPVVGRSALRVR